MVGKIACVICIEDCEQYRSVAYAIGQKASDDRFKLEMSQSVAFVYFLLCDAYYAPLCGCVPRRLFARPLVGW